MVRRRWLLVATVAALVLMPQPAWAHGAGGSADAISTVLLVATGAAVFWFRSLKAKSGSAQRLRWGLLPLAAVLLAGSLTVNLWGPKHAPSTIRPETSARLAIVEPVVGALTGPDITLRLELEGGTIVAQSQASELVPDGGYIHTYLDGKLVSMVDGLTQDLRGLAPGPHDVRAEFVAADNGPFKNRVVAAVVFEVKAP